MPEPMTDAERLAHIALKGQSGNNIPVGRISLTPEDWEFLLALAKRAVRETL